VDGDDGVAILAAVFGGDEVADGQDGEVEGALGICDLRMTIYERLGGGMSGLPGIAFCCGT